MCNKKSATLLAILIFVSLDSNSQKDQQIISLYEDTTQFSTIEEVLKLPELKDKVVYIDIWGTRCAPCITEFKNLGALKERYKNKPVAFLYLKSPYNFDDSQDWKKMIQQYKLEGTNVAMSITFYSNNFWNKYKDKYTEERSFGIPTYLIINKKGEVVNFDAPRPGEKEELFPLLDKELQ
jgi:thiol-disulfide isomerase/thioredoxin